jgi:oligosaccharide repeat unit polymerase
MSVRDLVFAPLASDLARVTLPDYFSFAGYRGERASGMLLTAASYGAVLVGLVAGWSSSPASRTTVALTSISYSSTYLRRLYFGSIIVWLIGILAHLYVLSLLSAGGKTLVDIAAERSAFTDPDALSNVSYHYARTLSSFALPGALCLLFLARQRAEKLIAVVSVGTLVLVELSYGGRGRVAYIFVTLMVIKFLRNELTVKKIVASFVVALLLLSALGQVRLGLEQNADALSHALTGVLGANIPRIDQSGWALVRFADYPLGIADYLSKVLGLIPGAGMEGAKDLWQYINHTDFRGLGQLGYGGENYSAAAELFAHGGVAFVITYMFTFGYLISYIFSRISSQRQRPLLDILTGVLTVYLVMRGVEARPASAITSVGPMVIALGIIGAYGRRGRLAHSLVYSVLLFLLGVVTWKLTGSDLVKALTQFLFLPIYVFSWKQLIEPEGRKLLSNMPIGPQA